MSTFPFSPVIIPTLCRYEHFCKCIESLRRCTHASQTDVYIGLDFPAKESHKEGYRKICEYLPTVTGFHRLIIFKRKTNFGSARNTDDLLLQAEKDHQSFIYMEDDVEVSLNFLDYMHKGMIKFQDDESVLAISGFSYHNDLPCGSSTYYRQRVGYSAWGVGMTFATYHRLQHELTRWYSIKKLLNPLTVYQAIHLSWGAFLFVIMHAINPQLHTDYVLSNYMLFAGKDVVMPTISLARNNGFDGSGEHCCSTQGYDSAKIDCRPTFDFIGDGRDHEQEIYHRLRKEKRRMMGFWKMISHIRAMSWVRCKRLIQQRF